MKTAMKWPVYNLTESGMNVTVGYIKQSSDDDHILHYMLVSDSGHLVPMNQAYVSRRMIETWIEKGDWFFN